MNKNILTPKNLRTKLKYISLIFVLISYTNLQGVPQMGQLISAWQDFLSKNTWKTLISGRTPISDPCGSVYELPNFLERPNEGFAIARMKPYAVAEPHYHPDGVSEVYFVLQGTALIVVAGKESRVIAGDTVVIPPRSAHFTIPYDDFVIAVVMSPPYDPENHKAITESDPSVGFDAEQFKALTSYY